MEWINLVLIVALGLLVGALAARLTEAKKELENARTALPSEKDIAKFVTKTVEKELPNALATLMDDRQAQLQELREEAKRSLRREAADLLVNPEFHQKLEQV